MRTVQIGHAYQTMFCLNDAFEAIVDHYPELQDVIAFCRAEVAEIEDYNKDFPCGGECDKVYSMQEHYEGVLHDIQEEAEAGMRAYDHMKRPTKDALEMGKKLHAIHHMCVVNT